MSLSQERNLLRLPQERKHDGIFPKTIMEMHLSQEKSMETILPKAANIDAYPNSQSQQNPGPNGARNPPTLSNPSSVVWP